MNMEEVWQNLHSNYQTQEWIDKPSIFAETAIQYFPSSGKVLDLGAGQGQDTRFFAEQGYDVVSTDIEPSALDLNLSKQSATLKKKFSYRLSI